MKCSVKGCSNSSNEPTTLLDTDGTVLKKDLTKYHSFPKNKRRCRIWVDIICNGGKKKRNGEIWKPTMHSKICSDHFEEKYIIIKDNLQEYLAKDAKPTLFLAIKATSGTQVQCDVSLKTASVHLENYEAGVLERQEPQSTSPAHQPQEGLQTNRPELQKQVRMPNGTKKVRPPSTSELTSDSETEPESNSGTIPFVESYCPSPPAGNNQEENDNCFKISPSNSPIPFWNIPSIPEEVDQKFESVKQTLHDIKQRCSELLPKSSLTRLVSIISQMEEQRDNLFPELIQAIDKEVLG